MKKLLALTTALMTLAPLAGQAQAINSNPLSDPRVRQAIAYAIDMDTVVDTLFEGRAVKAVGLLPNGPNKPDTLNPYDYDPEKARELLAEADWDSSRELDLVYYYNDQITSDFMAAVQFYLADVGIKMNYRLIEGDIGAQANALPDDPVNGPSAVHWDMLYGARAALALQEYFNRFAYGKMPTIPNLPEMNALVEQVNGSADPAVQRDGYHKMETIINDNAYIIPLYYQQLYSFDSDRVSRNGHPYGNEQYNYNWGVQDWTVTPDADGKSVMYTNTAPAQYFEVPWQNLGIFAMSKFGYDTILEADGNLTPIGGELAESYETSEDGLTFSFTLRDGITWHDGTPITPEDVVWSIETASVFPFTHPVLLKTFGSIEGAQEYIAGDADAISGIGVEGKTITLKFTSVDPNLLLSFSQFAPLPSSYFDGIDPLQLQQSDFWQKPVGSGPFMLEEVKMNDYSTFVPYAGYWNGTAKIEQIVAFPSYDGDPNLLRNAAAHRADFGYTKNTTDVAGLEELDYMNIHPVDIPYTRMFWINQFPHE